MAQLVLGAAGAAVGFYVGGPTGAQIGWAVGSAIGSTFQPTQRTQGPRLDDLRAPGVEYGAPIPWLRGVVRVPGLVWWASEKHETATTTSAGKGGGGTEQTTFTYDVDLIVGLCDHEILTVTRVWLNGKLVYNVRDDAASETIAASQRSPHWDRFTVYSGTATQDPDAVYEAGVGISNAPAYRGRAYAFIEALKLGSSGQLPVLSFEVAVEGAPGVSRTLMQTYFETQASGDPWDSIGCHPASVSGFTSNVVADSGYLLNSGATGPAQRIIYVGAQSNGVDALTFEGFVTVYSVPTVAFVDCIRVNLTNSIGVTVTYEIGLADGSSWEYQNDGVASNDYFLKSLVLGERIHWCMQFTATARIFHINGVMLHTEAGFLPPASGNVYIDFGGVGYTGDPDPAHYLVDSFRVRQEAVYGGGDFEPPTELPPPDCPIFAPELPTLREVVQDLCDRAGLDAAQVDASALDNITQPVRSLAVVNVMPQRSVLEALATSHVYECALSDKLFFFPRATTPVESIPFKTLGAAPDAASLDPFAPTIGSDVEIPAQACVRYINTENDYQGGAEYSDRVIAGQAATNVVELPVGLTAAEAKGVADILVMDGIASAVTVQVSLPLDYAKLEPGDVVTVYDADARPWRLRFVRRRDSGGVLTFDAISDDQGALLSAQITDETDDGQDAVAANAATVMELLDVPLLRDEDDGVHYLVAARGETGSWPGARVLRSPDNATFGLVAEMDQSAVLGTCTTVLGAWSGGVVMDEVNSVTVNVAHGELASATRDAVLNDLELNAMAVGSEIIRFCSAELLSSTPNIYKLTRLLRGQLGTEWRAGTHAASEACVLLNASSLRRISSEVASFNLTRYFLGVTYGTATADGTEEEFAHAGISSQPLAPVDVRAEVDSGDIVLTWKRRTRYRTTFTGVAGSIVPLGEAFEAYAVDVVLVSSSAVLRTISASTPTATYTTAQQSADGLGSSDEVRFDVRQLSDFFGPGRAGSLQMEIP